MLDGPHRRVDNRNVPTDKRQGIVYELIDPQTGDIRYVGLTIQATDRRMRRHLFDARSGLRDHRSTWIRSLLAVGRRPIMKVIERLPEDDLPSAESHRIAMLRFNGCDLVNTTDGGEHPRPSPEVRAKISEAKRHPSPETRAKLSAAATGRHPSAETRAKLSSATKGRPFSQEHCRRISAGETGHSVSERCRRLIGIANSVRVVSEETKRRMSLAHTRLSDASRANMAAAQRGRRHSQETLEKMRQAQTRRWAAYHAARSESIQAVNE